MELTQLQQIQVGNESTRGTAVAQTKELAGIETLSISDYFETLPNKELGYLAPSRGTVVVGMTGGSASFDGRVNYEQLPLYFDSLFGTDASPTGADPYVYSYNAPNTSTVSRRAFTLFKGSSNEGQSLCGSVLTSAEFTFAPGDFIRMSGEFIGSHVETDTLDAVSSSTVNFPDNSEVTISIGSYGGSLSALDCNVRQAVLSIDTGTTNHYGVGSLNACDYAYGEFSSTLTLTVNGDYAALRDEFEAMLGTTPTIQYREFQIQVTDGTNIIDINWSGYLSEPAEIYGDEDGVATLELTFNANYDATSNLTSWCDVEITNGESSMF